MDTKERFKNIPIRIPMTIYEPPHPMEQTHVKLEKSIKSEKYYNDTSRDEANTKISIAHDELLLGFKK